jgi:hypothetical protein
VREIYLEGAKARGVTSFLSESYANKGSFLREVDGYQFGVFVWDKYYFRVEGSVSATIIYDSSEPSKAHIQVIGSGGRYGLFFNLGSESAIEGEVLEGIREYANSQNLSIVE